MSHDRAEALADQVTQLRRELSLAEEGLANYQQEVNGLMVENANLRGVRDQLLKDDGETIERLRSELDAIKRTREQERDYADVCYENERLRAALQKYGFHTSKCSAGFPISDHCTCGFSDALRSAQPQTGKHK